MVHYIQSDATYSYFFFFISKIYDKRHNRWFITNLHLDTSHAYQPLYRKKNICNTFHNYLQKGNWNQLNIFHCIIPIYENAIRLLGLLIFQNFYPCFEVQQKPKEEENTTRIVSNMRLQEVKRYLFCFKSWNIGLTHSIKKNCDNY